MPRRAHRVPAAPLVACALALLVSGAPRLALELRPDPEHRCNCQRHGTHHECTCPRCHAAGAKAPAPRAGGRPPCHAAADPTSADRPARRATRTTPCMSAPCGSPGLLASFAFSTDLFAIPSRLGLAPDGERVERVRAMLHAPLDRAISPDTPPPRIA